MKYVAFILLLGAIVGGVYFFRGDDTSADVEVAAIEESVGPEIRREYYEITEDDVFTSAMEALDVSYADALAMVEAAEDVFDFTRIRVGKRFAKVYEDGVAVAIEYEPDPERVITVDLQNAFATTEAPIEYDIVNERVAVTIDESLFLSGLNAGISELALLKYVDMFAWEVDFATQVQKGDSFEMVYEKRFRDGKEAGAGDILYGKFNNVGSISEAYRFADAEGETTYYDPDGNSLVRPFLKSPLNYSRISSGYTNARFHPVTKTTMPHRAIDYAAPTGTPIKAVADGKVAVARWNGGFGHYIDIRHNSVYETQYAHLSRYAVSAGEHVKQGQVIGYVGSTGWSTGPHLHYQVKVNGTLTNPLEVEFPKGDPIADEDRPAFEQQKNEIDAL